MQNKDKLILELYCELNSLYCAIDNFISYGNDAYPTHDRIGEAGKLLDRLDKMGYDFVEEKAPDFLTTKMLKGKAPTKERRKEDGNSTR